MSVEALHDYLTKRAAYVDIDQRLRRHASDMQSLFKSIAAEPGSVKFEGGPEASDYRGTYNGKDHAFSAILSGQQLFDRLEAWRAARRAMNDAWRQLPADMRSGAKEPPAAYDRAVVSR